MNPDSLWFESKILNTPWSKRKSNRFPFLASIIFNFRYLINWLHIVLFHHIYSDARFYFINSDLWNNWNSFDYGYRPTGVTVTDREVKIGTETTLTCSLTELSVEVDISWWDGTNRLTDGKTFVQHKLKKMRFCYHQSYAHITVARIYIDIKSWNFWLINNLLQDHLQSLLSFFRLHIESRAVQLWHQNAGVRIDCSQPDIR